MRGTKVILLVIKFGGNLVGAVVQRVRGTCPQLKIAPFGSARRHRSSSSSYSSSSSSSMLLLLLLQNCCYR